MKSERTQEHFQARPFSAVFHLPRGPNTTRWRVRNSGVTGMPCESKETNAVLTACRILGISVREQNWGSAGNANSYKIEAKFLDGGIVGETGNYWFQERGVWVSGAKAVLALALQIGLNVRRSWHESYGLVGVCLEDLQTQLSERAHNKGISC